MRTHFFEKEVKKAQDNLNKISGNDSICNLDLRQAAIFTICHLTNLCQKIGNCDVEKERRRYIQEFVQIKNVLDKFFHKDLQEKRCQAGTAHSHKNTF